MLMPCTNRDTYNLLILVRVSCGLLVGAWHMFHISMSGYFSIRGVNVRDCKIFSELMLWILQHEDLKGGLYLDNWCSSWHRGVHTRRDDLGPSLTGAFSDGLASRYYICSKKLMQHLIRRGKRAVKEQVRHC